MFDFVSIIYYNKAEIDLLKIQLFSFKFVDINIINNIYILFNDSKDKNQQFETEYLNSIEKFVPIHLIKKIKIIYITDLICLDETYISNWFTQQFAKIYVSKIINSTCYIVLDSKNIFIKNADMSTFILDNKIKMYFSTHCDELLKYYHNCFDYFRIKDVSFYNPYKPPLYIQSTTPFVFITQECKNLIDFIENKENITLYKFFFRHKYTEFFLYFAWLCFVNKKDNYIFLDRMINNIIVGPHDPVEFVWNSWKAKLEFIHNFKPNVFSLSSKCVSIIDEKYKKNITNFLNGIFKNEMINDTIENALHP